MRRGEKPIWMPEDLDELEWTPEELEVAEKAIAPLRPSLVPQEAKREGSSLFIMPKLVSQMLGYQRDLAKSFDEMIAELAAAAGTPSNNQFTGFSEGDEEAKAAIAAATVTMLGAAAAAFVGAYQTGRDFGMDITGRAVVSPQEQEIRLAAKLRKNASYVTLSLMADVETAFQQITRDPMLPPEKAAAAVEAMGEAMASRVTMYARPLWGLGHQGFGEEMQGAGKLLNWVVTSMNSCPDCPQLAALGPYGGLNMLPTYPGAGETECFVDPRTPVLTEKGWRRIDRVAVGDLVLTHRGRFMPVEAIPVRGESLASREYVRVKIDVGRGARWFTVTPDHRFLGASGWVEARNVKPGDVLTMMMKTCSHCGTAFSIRGRDVKREFCDRACQTRVIGAAGWTAGRARLVAKHGQHGAWFKGKPGRPVSEVERQVRRARLLGKSYVELHGADEARRIKQILSGYRKGRPSVEVLGIEAVRKGLLKSRSSAGLNGKRGRSGLELTMAALEETLRLVQANHDGRYVRAEAKVVAVKIRRVSPSNRRKKYDLTVCTDHSYVVGGGVVSHNCRTNCLCLLVEVPGGTIVAPLPVTGAMTLALVPPDYGITRRQVRELRREEIRAMLDEYANKLLARKARTSERSATVQKGLELMASQMGAGFKALAGAIKAVADRPQTPIIVQAPEVNVDVAQAPPVVVPAPEVHVQAPPAVMVPAPEVKVEVHVPEPRLKRVRKDVVRGADKLLDHMVETEEFVDP